MKKMIVVFALLMFSAGTVFAASVGTVVNETKDRSTATNVGTNVGVEVGGGSGGGGGGEGSVRGVGVDVDMTAIQEIGTVNISGDNTNVGTVVNKSETSGAYTNVGSTQKVGTVNIK